MKETSIAKGPEYSQPRRRTTFILIPECGEHVAQVSQVMADHPRNKLK
jgi:hypothetical protein